MQLKPVQETVSYYTKNGELSFSREEYEALREVFKSHKIDLPEWKVLQSWNETRTGYSWSSPKYDI